MIQYIVLNTIYFHNVIILSLILFKLLPGILLLILTNYIIIKNLTWNIIIIINIICIIIIQNLTRPIIININHIINIIINNNFV